MGDARAQAKEQIAFSRVVGGYWQIWTMNPDGTEEKAVTDSPFDKRDPIWVKDDQAIAYRTNNGQLFIFDLKSGSEQELLTQLRNISNPDYNNATGGFIFTRFDPRSTDVSNIWKADESGENSATLTRDNILKYQPVFSFRGDKIAYVQGEPKTLNHHIWLMGADGSNPRQLTTEKGFFTLPSFSPDGTELTLTANYQDDNYEIYTMDIASLKMKRITHDPALDTHSRFSPDGKSLVFVSDRSGTQQIWVMGRDGANPKQITTGTQEAINPAWTKGAHQ